MNTTKAQKDIFKNLLNGAHIRKFDFDKDNIFISPTGFYGYVLPKVLLQVNIDKIPEMKEIEGIKEAVTEENRYDLTNECKILMNPRKTYAVKLENGEKTIFLNEKYLECFQNPRFYGFSNTLVVVTEATAKGDETIVGAVCPIRV